MSKLLGAAAWTVALAGCATTANLAPPAPAPAAAEGEDARITALLSRMSLEHKVAQLIQPQINSVTPEEMRQYRYGSYLNGGNGGPYGNEFAPAADWLKLADEMWEASTAPLPNGEPAIPTIWGTDAVHGHTNVVGATIFPHNIGLGAARDPDLVRRIGAATAAEIAATGIDWNFSPTVAVAQDDRWGRTYESYSEDPAIAAELGSALVEGLQGKTSPAGRIGDGHVIATAKHFFGDGGTAQGVDQGNVDGDLAQLEAIHARPYPAAIAAGVEAVMASFNSINGTKMHGNKPLLTGLLRGTMGFTGVVVGDWNGHAQIPGCTNSNCPQALLAGLDIYMVPDDAKALHASLLAQVKDGTIPLARVDEAVGRVLRMKLRAGLLDPGAKRPSARVNGGKLALLGAPEHRAIAREAVAKSQVLLKNNGVLPLKRGASILVAGRAADDIAQAAGGWTLTWQGGEDLTNARFPGATSIWAGLKTAATEAGGAATLSPDGSYSARPDVAVVVFGEKPYAEFSGDRKDLVFADTEGLDLLRKYRAAGIKTVALFLSGRPLWMNREMNAADAFVASWLPGGEGAGVADMLYGRRPATGRLSFSWPAACTGQPVNGPEGALFQRGYGLSFGQATTGARLSEACAILDARSAEWFDLGRLGAGITARGGEVALPNLRGMGGGITARGIDRNRQEDAREIVFAPGATLTLADAGRATGGFRIVYELATAPTAPVTLNTGGKALDITAGLTTSAGKGWRELIVTGACAPATGRTLSITSAGPLTLRIARIARQDVPAGVDCSF
ncbi:beta-glucosidase [Sphingomonas kaistensis]|uniref:Beta-glucosidase n=1 Tax=Sphingomonas kaistensis TaxID=298708 RepID=A0A7X6BGG7_9SPHN|nr:glycoside hydrolase family 3 N-terminal domain-containing protein [Sphingomonas kaistensis]NJC06444.1 beta-glucosidase [Sphingomonas kaistensis]